MMVVNTSVALAFSLRARSWLGSLAVARSRTIGRDRLKAPCNGRCAAMISESTALTRGER